MNRYSIQFDSGRRYLIFDGATSTCPVHRRGEVYWKPDYVGEDDQDKFNQGSATAEQAEAAAARFDRDYEFFFG